MTTITKTGASVVHVATAPCTVDSVVVKYSGDSAVYAQIHDQAPVSVLTFTGVSIADETVTVGDVTYTFKAAPTTVANEVEVGATTAISAANLILAINAGPTGSGTLWGSATVANPKATAYAGPADRNDTTATVPASTELVTIMAKGSTDAVATTEAGTNTAFSVATLPRLSTSDAAAQSTRLYKGQQVTLSSQACTAGAIVALSSTDSTYTAATRTDFVGDSVDEDRVNWEINTTLATTAGTFVSGDTTVLDSDSDRLFSYTFDGDLTDDLGGSALVKTAGTDLFVPSPKGGLAYRASVEHATHAANEASLELTAAMSISAWVRFVALPNAVWLTFANGASAAEADNALFSINTTTAGAFIWSQENSTGTASADTAAPLISVDEWVQVTYTRPTAATSVKLYLNGYLTDTSGALTAPTGGTASILSLGGTEAAVDSPVDVASLTIWDVELTAAQVLAHCNRERRI